MAEYIIDDRSPGLTADVYLLESEYRSSHEFRRAQEQIEDYRPLDALRDRIREKLAVYCPQYADTQIRVHVNPPDRPQHVESGGSGLPGRSAEHIEQPMLRFLDEALMKVLNESITDATRSRDEP